MTPETDPPCRICSKPIHPGAAVIFHRDGMSHLTCLPARTAGEAAETHARVREEIARAQEVQRRTAELRAEADKAAARAAEARRRAAALVLNVDDRADARYLRTRALRHAGFDVVEAEGGRDAIDRIVDRQPDLVLLDVMLPDTDGFELCRRIRDHSQVPVLMISASLVDERYRAAGAQAGASGYLVEPVSQDELVAAVATLTAGR